MFICSCSIGARYIYMYIYDVCVCSCAIYTHLWALVGHIGVSDRPANIIKLSPKRRRKWSVSPVPRESPETGLGKWLAGQELGEEWGQSGGKIRKTLINYWQVHVISKRREAGCHCQRREDSRMRRNNTMIAVKGFHVKIRHRMSYG